MSKQLIKKEQQDPKPLYYYDHLQVELLQELIQIYRYISKNYSDIITSRVSMIQDKMEVSKYVKALIYPQLAWWVILKEPIHSDKDTLFSEYLKRTRRKQKNKSAVFRQTLDNWQNISPGFYMTKSVADHQQSGILLNIVGLKRYTITVCNEVFKPLKRGELLTGFLLPIGNGMYTSPVDLFHITADDAPRVTWEVLLHFHQHTISSAQSPPRDLYLSLLKFALEAIDG